MPVEQQTLFRARDNGNGSDVTSVSISKDESFQRPVTTGIIELTKNSKYCVSRLPASPSVLGSDSQDTLNGYADHFSNYSLVVSDTTINVWSYKSTDATPLSIQFPVTQSSLPLAILTRPMNATTEDPGLAIIDSTSGHVKFYESVQHAPALGLMNNKLLELTIPLYEDEYITLAENVEPAGIVVATSLKRCVLLSLKDYLSKPKLSVTELLAPQSKGGILSYFTGEKINTNSGVMDEIVSIRSSKLLEQGLIQDIFIQDSVGKFTLIRIQLHRGANGSVYLDKKNSYQQYISTYLERSMEGYLPGKSLNVSVLDLWPLLSHEHVYIALCSVDQPSNDLSLILVTLKIDSTGVLLYGTHKLNPMGGELFSTTTNKPRMFLPSPGTTAFVVIGNSVILTDVNPSYIESRTTVQYYTPRWEDTIRLRSSIQIIGQGYEDQGVNANPAIVLITNDCGVLRIERFSDNDDDDDDEAGDSSNGMLGIQDAEEPISIIKSHIEQAIFYADSSAIEFDLDEDFPEDVVTLAVVQIIDAILDSSSPYLPSFLPSVSDFLVMKSNLYHKLIVYVKKNFELYWGNIVPHIVERLEKTDVAYQLWVYLDGKSHVKYQDILKNVVIGLGDSTSTASDPIRKFFSHDVVRINEVLTKFIVKLSEVDTPLSFLLELLVKTMYDGVFNNEKEYILNELEIQPRQSWIFETDLIIKFEEIFRKVYCNGGDEISTETRKQNVEQLCEVLYYFVTSAVQFMQLHDKDQLREYLLWYNKNKPQWIKALIDRGLYSEAIKICERYHDLLSLVEVLEHRKNTEGDSPQLRAMYDEYFENFGYEFASSLYSYYVKKDEIQALLLGFENYREFAIRYFEENRSKTSKVSWIRYFLDSNFAVGSSTLIESASGTDNSENKELTYSLAKLSAIAAQQNGSTPHLEEIVTDANSNLIQIRIQRDLFTELLKDISGKGDLFSVEYVSKNFRNEQVDYTIFNELLDIPIKLLAQKKSLNSTQLINVLTLIKPSVSSGKNFANALRIASLLTNESTYIQQTRLIWLRLLTLTDEWSSLTDTANRTDESVKHKIANSVLFKTLKLVGVDNNLVDQLNVILQDANNSIEVDEKLAKKSLETLNSFLELYSLQSWVESIKQEVRSSNKV